MAKPDAAIAFMQTNSPGGSSIQYLPQECANWLYQASHYAVPLIQSLLGTGKAFDKRGRYLDAADGRPASGGQVVACWGTEMAARTERALFAYDVDMDWWVFVTPDVVFEDVWKLVKRCLEPLGFVCHGPNSHDYYRICPATPLTYNTWRELCHEARGAGINRQQILEDAREKKAQNKVPSKPHGLCFLDFNVVTIEHDKEVAIPTSGSKFHMVPPHALFPVIEGFFGPLRIPLPATPAVLDAEYETRWRTTRAVKTFGEKSGVSKYTITLEAHFLRSIHPSVPLLGDPSYLGCYSGAGMDPASSDTPWRWL